MVSYFHQPCQVRCDGLCGKAWGIHSRPRQQLSDNPDDIAWLADGELGAAPADPGTYEGNDGKPDSAAEFPNKWCVRECERCAKSPPGKPDRPRLPDWSKRRYNLKEREES